jgi:putative tryptophan/tyrosine transport system substrate-binding protein
MRNPVFTRRRALALATGLVSLAGFPVRADTGSLPEWFGLDMDVLNEASRAWRIAVAPGDKRRIEIRRVTRNEQARRIFVFYPRRSSAYDTAISKILAVFADKNINAAMTVLNYENDDARGQAALDLAISQKAELIFAMGSESTAWLYKHFLNGPIPVVSVCSKDPVLLGQTAQYDAGSGTNFAYTSLNMPVDVQFAYILALLPEIKNIGVLVDATNVSAIETQAKPIADIAKRRGVQVLNLAVKDPKQAKEELAVLVAGAVTTMRKSDPNLSSSVFWITGSTSVFNEIGTINRYSDRVPVLSVVPDVVDGGDLSAVLSIGIGFESNAHLAAIYGSDILNSRRHPGEFPVGIVSPPDIAINLRVARHIGLRVPFQFIESAGIIYDYEGRLLRRGELTPQVVTERSSYR